MSFNNRTFLISQDSATNKDYLINFERTNKMSMAMRLIRVVRVIRIVKIYKAGVVLQRNLDMKKKLENLRNIQKRDALKKNEDRFRSRTRSFYRTNANDRAGAKLQTTIAGRRTLQTISEFTDISKAKHKLDESIFLKPADARQQEHDRRKMLTNALTQFQKQIEIGYEDLPTQSKISKIVSESITQKFIVLILLFLFLSPLTEDNIYIFSSTLSYNFLCQSINNIHSIYGNITDDYTQIIHYFLDNGTDPNFEILDIKYNNISIPHFGSYNISDYRRDEIGYAYSPEGLTQILYSNKVSTRISAAINIARTIFALICLFSMAVVLESDVRKMVLEPLEVMIDVVETVAKDPVDAKSIENMQTKIRHSIKKLRNKHNKDTVPNTDDLEGAQYEIKVIQLAIIKISALLAIGFGEAGGEILRENLGTHQELNPMLPGKRKDAIFGFCDIRGFPDVNVALQEKTMVFVNEIAEIVHSSVDKFGGAANKNIGDAFLMVWKINQTTNENPSSEEIFNNNKSLTFAADQALLGFLTTIKRLSKYPHILAYKHNPEIKNRVGKNYRVNMGFGLHLGWAIEGAIGSFYKIDCSYLSPNVNMSARLEAATRQYGVFILLSGDIYECLSDEMKGICRLIDVVTVKGSVKPVQLYTVHVNLNLKHGKDKKKILTMKEKRKSFNLKKSKLYDECGDPESLGRVVLNKKGFKELLADKRPSLFHEKFNEGVKAYIKGDWPNALLKLKDAKMLDPTDGPTLTLFRYIRENHSKAPDTWKGFRELTSK